jgi:hypothetical protein
MENFFSTVKKSAKLQEIKEYLNTNKKSQNLYKKCGEGAYASPLLDCDSEYGQTIIMCRVNPKKIRIPQGDLENKIYITDGTRNSIRPYRILIDLDRE